MIGLLPLAVDLPYGVDPLKDAVVFQQDAYFFTPPKFVARFVKNAAFTGTRLIYVTQSPPFTLGDPTFETGLHVWNGSNQTLRSFRNGTEIEMTPMGKESEAVAAFVTPFARPEQPVSMEVFRFNQGQTSTWTMPAGFQPSGYRAYEEDYVQINWLTRGPFQEASIRPGELYDPGRSIIIEPTGEPLALPEGVELMGRLSGVYLGTTRGKPERYYALENAQWRELPVKEFEALAHKYWDNRIRAEDPQEKAPAFMITQHSARDKSVDPPLNRRELWVVTTDQFGPNRILAAPDHSWFQKVEGRIAYIEKGNLFIREIVKVPRSEFDPLAAKAEEELTKRNAQAIVQIVTVKTGAEPSREITASSINQGFRYAAGMLTMSYKAFTDLSPETEIGRIEGRYGTRVVLRGGPGAWISRER